MSIVPLHTSYVTISKEYGLFTIQLTQQVQIMNDGRKKFGMIRAIALLDNKHCLDSWIYNPTSKMTDDHLQTQYKHFQSTHHHTINEIRASKKHDKLMAEREELIKNVLEATKVVD